MVSNQFKMNHFEDYLTYLTGYQENLNKKKEGNLETLEQQLIDACKAESAERPLIAYMSDKKKRKYDPNDPKSFSETCKHPGLSKAISREYSTIVQRNTCRCAK